MYLGQQLIAPRGFATLSKDISYHYLLEDEERQRVILIGLSSKPANAWLEFISSEDFERAIKTNRIRAIPVESAKRMPPWLSSYEKTHFERELMVQVTKKPAKDSTLQKKEGREAVLDRYKALVDRRQAKVREVREEYKEIFKQDNPQQILNRLARAATPAQKENRFRLWALTHLAFPGNEWTLMPPQGGRGSYDRTKAPSRLGRKLLDGSERGFNVTAEMKAKIKTGFWKHKKRCKTLAAIYIETLKSEFKCQTREHEKRAIHFHPRGEGFPTVGQFRYWCYQLYGKETVLRILMGDIAYQNEVQAPIGSYAQGVRDILEVTNTDVSHTKEHPKSLLSGCLLPKLAMCKVVDSLTGKILSVSGGFGGETTSLYRQALFIMGAPVEKLNKILGIRLSRDDFPEPLLPLALHHDQGPGGAIDIREIHDKVAISHSMSPAYNPRNNATVESKHARAPERAGRPEHQVSSESSLQMYVRAFLKAVAQNKSADATNRATPDQLSRGLRTPKDLYDDYLARGRVVGIAVPFDELVKKYLPPIEVTVSENFLTYRSVRYRSKDLASSEFGKNIRKFKGARIRGYCLEITTRVIWVAVDGELIEVDAVDPVQSAKDANQMTLFEHNRHDLNVRHAESQQPADRAAAYSAADDEADRVSNRRHSKPTTLQGRAKVNRKTAGAEATAMRP